MAHQCAGRHHPIRWHEHARFIEQDLWIALSKERGEPPGRRCLAIIEQSGVGQNERPDTGSGDVDTHLMPLLQLRLGINDIFSLERWSELFRCSGTQRRDHHPIRFQGWRYWFDGHGYSLT